jgi:AraC-like DNA-binding protein
MVCTDAGYTVIKPNAPYPPDKNAHPGPFRDVEKGRILPEFQIIYISKGEGIFVVEGNIYKVVPGSFLFIFPGMRHHYKPDFTTGWDEYWVGFKGAFFTNMVKKNILSKEHIYLEIGLHINIISIFNQIFQEVLSQQPLYQVKACSGILSLIAEIVAFERRKKQPNHYQKIVEKAKYLIALNLHKYKAATISEISEQIGVSIARLNYTFKTYTSMTPYQYCIHLKIHEAKKLLENEDLSIKEIAHSLGFDDQGHFSRLFKSKTGVAPSEWKFFYTEK